jgi:two-component system sensor histidine kinase KdpD
MTRALLPRPDFGDRAGASSRPRVLVCDDNAGFRESLLVLLNTGDIEVVGEVASGFEALKVAPTIGPDGVLLAVRRPGMAWLEACRRLKALMPDVGVVALSGHEDQDIVREMLLAGASGYVLKDSDGDEILHAVMEAAEGGAVLSAQVTPSVIEDLTESLERERRRTRELEAAQAALVERSARRHELVARLSHELRTPVTVILGIAQTMAKGNATPQQRSELLDRLVSRSLDLARLVERFELTIDVALTEQVDVANVAHQVGMVSDRVRGETDHVLPVASLNPAAAARILEELVDNALRFSPDGAPVTIRVRLSLSAIEVRVSDRGSGIGPADAERIFGPLEQLEDLNVRVHQGAGIGLALARTAARAMGGDVVLEASAPGSSTFLWTIAIEED